jgi:glycosyltransferase involved in cell wall biosynthesis
VLVFLANKILLSKITMNKNQPLVSVLMTAYNAESFIGEAIQSILQQTYKNLELIIVDDKSTDKTFSIAKHFVKQDSRIRLYRLPKNVGPSIASNFGIQKARGSFLARMDADDSAFPNRIRKQVQFLRKHLQVVIVGSQCTLIDTNGDIIGEKHYPTENKVIYELYD